MSVLEEIPPSQKLKAIDLKTMSTGVTNIKYNSIQVKYGERRAALTCPISHYSKAALEALEKKTKFTIFSQLDLLLKRAKANNAQWKKKSEQQRRKEKIKEKRRLGNQKKRRRRNQEEPRRTEEKRKNPRRQHRKGGKEKQRNLPGQGSFEQEEIEEQGDEEAQANA